MIAIFFAFGPDSECLYESVQAFKTVYSDGIVGICDDPDKPIDDDMIAKIAPDYYEQRAWDSKGNLNGWGAVRGILEFQKKMHGMFPGHKGAIKMDCDTLLLVKDWIDEDAPICGIDAGCSTFFYGMCRYLKESAVDSIINFINNKVIWEDRKVPEDATIANCTMFLYGQECKRYDWSDVAFSYNYKHLTANNKLKPVVTFGNRSEITLDNDRDKRTTAAIHMGYYRRKYLETKK
jgi:cation diffusion facilitator CzcD-associated flavoprotein CzcO